MWGNSMNVLHEQEQIQTAFRTATYFNASVLKERKMRENEISDLLNKLPVDEKNNLTKIDFKKEYGDKTLDDVKDRYKEKFYMQENFYLYESTVGIKDVNMTKQFALNSIEIEYMEKNILSDTEKLELQLDVKEQMLDKQKQDREISSYTNNYNQNLERHFIEKKAGNDTTKIEQELYSDIVNKKILSKNSETFSTKKDLIIQLNKDDVKKLNKKIETSKQIDKLYSNDLMWKVVEQKSKNSIHLNNGNPDVSLDARINTDKINLSASQNSDIRLSSSQQKLDSSYLNSYRNLTNVEKVRTTNQQQIIEKTDEKNHDIRDNKENRKRGR